MSCRRTPQDGERGSATLELVVLAPALLALIALVVLTGRIATAYSAVESAARDAARRASIARAPAEARRAATTSAAAALRREGLRCAPSIAVDTSGFSRQVGTPAQVVARVTCTVQLGDLLPGLPGQKTVRASFASPIDPYRGRALGFADPGGSSAGNERAKTGGVRV
ncbi:pilus assembly protein [Microbispora hainanensis]|uniref:TadE/TadG family type IV pilus assembly protein n=1 Tax=Microbispora TaxID=2005 RepID=UPI001157FF3C|nr:MULTISPECIES: TadE/TadG family type IV pilus assembly protein [Microbispora]NJP30099.1 pilus assembly protein [Microbispora sp. CL1-1]TQS03017.1 pilus assembly protein [Microbispora sp. SCL1-1]